MGANHDSLLCKTKEWEDLDNFLPSARVTVWITSLASKKTLKLPEDRKYNSSVTMDVQIKKNALWDTVFSTVL